MVGRQCRSEGDSEAEAGRKPLLRFRHSRHPWRSDAEASASRWPWTAYRPSGTNFRGPALPLAAKQRHVGRRCRPDNGSEAEAGRKPLLRFRHSRHPWRSDAEASASRWPWMAYRPSGANFRGPALPLAAKQRHVGRRCRPDDGSEAEAGRKPLLRFRHSRHPWRSDAEASASRWPWTAYRPSGTNFRGPALPLARRPCCATNAQRFCRIRRAPLGRYSRSQIGRQQAGSYALSTASLPAEALRV